MQNPFESGHIKNYLLFYAAIVLIMVLFFMASSLFHEIPVVEQKVFETKSDVEKSADGVEVSEKPAEADTSNRIILLDKAY